MTRLDAYLNRIGIARPSELDAAGLLAVQAAHRQAIPFENIDVRLRQAIPTESQAVFDKLVTQRRGGFCFEHNRLLSDMLAAMGMANRVLLARVTFGDPPALPPLTHCLLLVTLPDGQRMIADGGFGGTYCPPLPLADGAEATSGDGARHRLTQIGAPGTLPGEWLLERMGPPETSDGRGRDHAAWEQQYAFELADTAPADLVMGSHFASTHPSARHVNCHVASRVLPDGFVSLLERQFSRYRAGHPVERREVADVAEYRDLLAREIGVDLPVETLDRLPLWAGAD
ncbi:arylamine N-acetyltransferase family protein [Aurantiacibacter luteus]|uniref:Arylamine N-acetyltransferase n=1 Tax=Aurantiacibacter luteus TaxID=1581420 RepID=A0A0G9MUA9_9SPHN|nr:arylamine N-acetyltransferase [Aurantiacibacter luteus]KLE34139.1 hypothetical protein AAW00_07610 [Aurantiacibacter luteus]